MATSVNQFNASPSMAGYLFQCRLALLSGLQMLKKSTNGQITIEKFDDISFESDDYRDCLIQAKHHINPKSLDDLSIDLWKTLHIWINHLRSGVLEASDYKFILITTAAASPGSAMECLRLGKTSEMIELARNILTAAAKRSNNKKSEAGRFEFLALSKAEATLLLSKVEVLDRHPNLVDVKDEIEGELILLSPKHVSLVADYLEGWWFGIVCKCLVTEGSASIPIQNIVVKASEIGNMFKDGGLPIDDPEVLGVREYSSDDEAAIFVRQMRVVKLNESTIKRGVQDFYRATAQRSKWARENLLLDGEAARYDANLKDRFRRRFDANVSQFNPVGKTDCEKFGRQLCHWASQQEVQFRNVVQVWITSGSFHGLSDRVEIGWHPDYSAMFNLE